MIGNGDERESGNSVLSARQDNGNCTSLQIRQLETFFLDNHQPNSIEANEGGCIEGGLSLTPLWPHYSPLFRLHKH